MDWDYAELSKKAKTMGGPEELVNKLINSGKTAGKKSMIPWIGTALGIGALLSLGIQKIITFRKSNKMKSEAELEAIKSELIRGIKDYDDKDDSSSEES